MKYTALLLGTTFAIFSGCMIPKATNTPRSAIEQLLLSQAADRAIDQLVLPDELMDKRIFIDESKFIAIDKEYVVALLKQKLFLSGAMIVNDAKNAQIIVEITSGGIGTDWNKSMIGLPELPIPLPTTSAIFTTPELSIWHLDEQTASCKLNINIHDAITGKVVSLHPRLYGNSFMDRHSIFMTISWTNDSLANDPRNFANGKDSFMHPDPAYKWDLRNETYYNK